MLSAAFIMAANSWMQHPVGYTTNNSTHQPQLNNIWALFTNPVFLWGYTHVILASLVTGAVIMLGVSAWHLRKKHQVEAFRRTAVISLVVLLPSVALAACSSGSELGVVEGTYQPMKIAAAEALWSTCASHCAFSLFQIGGGQERRDPDPDPRDPRPALHPGHQPRRRRGAGPQQPERAVPEGVRAGELHPQRLHPVLVDAGHGLPGLAGLRSSRCGGPGSSTAIDSNSAKWFLRIAPWVVILPFLINTAGWMLTENGRQPWIVQGLMLTKNGVSPSVSATDIWISLVVFYLIYAVLGVADAG